MEIIITASFDQAQGAALAASALGMVQGGGLGMLVTTESLSAAGAPIAGLGRAKAESRWGDHLVRVRCAPEHESFAVGELAALGARKISVSGKEQA